MVTKREKRRIDLEGMTPKDLEAEFERVIGKGAYPTHPDRGVSTILDKEYGSTPKVYFSDKCEHCGGVFPATATPVKRRDDGGLRYEVECTMCGKWTITHGADKADLCRNFEVQDDSDYSALSDSPQRHP